MARRRQHGFWGLWRNERGFTLPEVLVTIIIMGAVFAVTTSLWFNVTESRRVDSATNQLAADLRLAHSSAINQLTTWRVVLVPERAEESEGFDYYLVKLDSTGNVVAGSTISRTLPDDARVVEGDKENLKDDATVQAVYALLGLGGAESRTIEFDTDGSMDTYSKPAALNKDVIDVTGDGDPTGRITFNETTSRINVA